VIDQLLASPEPPLSRTEEIAAILRDEILQGQYRAGERLPSERDLTSRFDTSRGAVREAFKKLEQLGIASIQPGGARVVPVEQCTLDVLGPLLDLNEVPDAKLVDEVLEIFGVLMGVAARSALEKATDKDLAHAEAIISDMLAHDGDEVRQHDALRRLSIFFVEIADHLVLRLIINGLRTSFMARMKILGLHPKLDDSEDHREIVNELKNALNERNAAAVGDAIRRLNRVFRHHARDALLPTQADSQRSTA